MKSHQICCETQTGHFIVIKLVVNGHVCFWENKKIIRKIVGISVEDMFAASI